MTTTLKPNIPLLREVLAQIDAHPELHRQADFAYPTACGTAFCVAGWAVVLSPGYRYDEEERLFVNAEGNRVDPDRTARELLRIDGWTAWGNDLALFDSDISRAGIQVIAERLATIAGEDL